MPATNFQYVKSFPLTSGSLYTVAVDSQGTLYSENVIAFPGVLTPLHPKAISGSYAFSTTQNDVEYICFSNLLNGTDIPRQYNPQPANPPVGQTYTLDRISQVGPGAPPTFQATVTSTTSQATITAWSAVGGIVTFTASNNFTAGEIVTLSGFHTSTFFNGMSFSVLGTGLSVTQFEVAFSNTSGGSDSGIATPQYGYPIANITQPVPPYNPPFFGQIALWSSGPGQTSAGTTITMYYGGRNLAQDATLVNQFNAGIPVYVFISGAPFGNGTQLVTTIGTGNPPGETGPVPYFCFLATSSNYQKVGGPNITGNVGSYRVSLATMATQTPIPGLSIGDEITISGVTPSGWNGTWSLVNILNAGVYNIIQTQMTNGTATYSFTWGGTSTAIAPQNGQLITITGTLNGNGIFNVTDATISNVTGTATSGTFDIVGFPLMTFGAQPESGLGQTAGTSFQFDPGQTTLGSQTSPIFGNSTGNTGFVIVAGSNTAIAAGTRQAVCFFETENGLKTACSSPITFTTQNNATYIVANNIPIGPPDVIRRWIAFTSAGANGVPGPNFYTIDTPVTYTLNNQTFRYSATYINDNVTTTAKFTFTDSVLLAGEEIDVQGNDLFNLIELGSVGWNAAYAQRMFYGLEQSKVLNFTNMSFDGGFLPNPTGNVVPLGWGIDPASNGQSGTAATITAFSITSNVVTFTAANTFIAGQPVTISGLSTGTYLNSATLTILATGLSSSQFEANFIHANVGNTSDSGTATPQFIGGTLINSPVFGNAFYINNTVGSTQTTLGMITQNAYQDAYNVPIILPNTLYSVRVTASIPSGNTTGTLIVDLTGSNAGIISGSGVLSGYGATYGQFVLPFASMTKTMAIYAGTILTAPFTTGVPVGLLLRVFAQNIAYGADVAVDRIEIFPTAQPLLATNIRVSYVDNFEAFDGVTGNIGLSSHNTQTCYGAAEMHDQLYFLQSSSMQSTQDVPGVEPSGPGGGWPVHEVSNRVGTCGIHAYDYGEEWILTACRNGLYGFNGGQPIRIDYQQKEVWELINWSAAQTIVVRNDMLNRRILVAVPLPTPNRYLPLAPTNTNPTSPNVVLMWNYQGLNDFNELVSGHALHTTMFGTLAAVDMRLKFNIWQITTPYMGFVIGTDLITPQLNICNGTSTGKIYTLSQSQLSDDGSPINSTYFSYGFVNSAKASQNPLLGFHRKRYQMIQNLISGSGTATVKAYPNYILNTSTLAFNPYTYTVPGGIRLQANPPDDIVRPLNVAGNRAFFSWSTNAVGAAFTLSKCILIGTIDQYSQTNPNAG